MRTATFGFIAITALSWLPAQAPELPPVIRAGLEAYKSGGVASALDAWRKDSPVAQQTIPSARAGFEQIEAAYGHIVGYEVVGVVPIGTHASRSYVMLLFEKGPVYARFDCYKAGDAWIMTAFQFNGKPDEILPSKMLGH